MSVSAMSVGIMSGRAAGWKKHGTAVITVTFWNSILFRAGAKTCDTTRPITAGLAALLISNEVGLADALDAVGYNYREYRYPPDHAAYPGRIIYGSKNGMRLEFWRAVLEKRLYLRTVFVDGN